jgi:glycosyltransferase involved in cell wall biosynthesis
MTPVFSIVVPTRDRPQQLTACLAALERLDYTPQSFEVIVVDDGSEDAVAIEPDGLPVTLVRQENAGPAHARNTGAEAAAGRFLAFTDDDCEPDPGWLRAAERALEAGASAVTGRTVNDLDGGQLPAASQLLIDYLYGYYNTDRDDARFATSNNLVVERETFLGVGGFDTMFRRAAGEDREVVHRLRRNGHRLVYAPAAVVRHRHRLDPVGFWQQHFDYGRGAALYHRRAGGIPFEPLSFYRDLVFAPRGDLVERAQLGSLLAVTQLANAVGYAFAVATRTY